MEIHPEHLLEKARRGALDRSESAALARHLAECSACALLHAAAGDFDAIPLDAQDRVASQRIAQAALGRERRASAPSRLAPMVAAAIALLVLATAGGTAALIYVLRYEGKVVEEPQPEAPATPVREQRRRGARPAPESEEARPIELPLVEIETERRERREPAATAAELLTRATEARRAGEYREAARLYERLQRTYPTSREARVSQIALGRVRLDHLDDPRGALAQFRSYLTSNRSGALAEEARVGAALALRRLGRAGEERAAWEELLRHHPLSIHADDARARIRELSSR